MPKIPGYIGPVSAGSLAEIWQEPSGPIPKQLWPARRLNQILRNPTSWVTIEENFYTPEEHGGAGCVLVPASQVDAALRNTTWIGSDLGDFGVWSTGEIQEGLTDTAGDLKVEFFVQG